MEPACSAHHELVAQASDPDASDAVLQRYAEAVPTCPDCKHALARSLQVHPVVLQPSGDPPSIEGLRRLWEVLHQPVPANRLRWAGLGTALAIAALLLWALRPLLLEPTTPPSAPSSPLLAQPAPPSLPTPVRPDARVALPEPPAPPPPATRPAPLPAAPSPLEQPLPPPTEDAVAMLDEPDWPAPPFEELRGGSSKGLADLRAAQLVLSGVGGGAAVGDMVQLTVVASSPAALSVCVSGPERGVVWRGGVPAGRVELTRNDQLQSFAFSAPGTYRFSLSPDPGPLQQSRCVDPVHVVEVEVDG